jgi:hypothetical protein
MFNLLINILRKPIQNYSHGGTAKKLDQTVDMSVQNETFKLLDDLWKV